MFRNYNDGFPRNNQSTTIKIYHLLPPRSSAQHVSTADDVQLRLHYYSKTTLHTVNSNLCYSCTQKVACETPGATQATTMLLLLLNSSGVEGTQTPFSLHQQNHQAFMRREFILGLEIELLITSGFICKR